MKIQIKLHEGKKTLNLGGKPSVSDVLKEMGINSETVLVKRDKDIIIEEEKLRENDKIEVIRIVSGG